MLLLLQKTGIVQQRAPGSWSPGPSRGLTASLAVIAALPTHGAPPEGSFLQIPQG